MASLTRLDLTREKQLCCLQLQLHMQTRAESPTAMLRFPSFSSAIGPRIALSTNARAGLLQMQLHAQKVLV